MITVQEQQITHYASVSSKHYKQPKHKDMGKLTNYMKHKTQAERIPIKELLQLLSNGHNAIISNYELDHNQSIRFVSSSLILVDIDDDNKVTDPKQVLDNLSSYCAGLFYTWSHEIKGNRYRLVFQLDKQITNELDYEVLVDYLLLELKGIGLPVDDVASRPTEIVRGGNKGYLLNDAESFIKVSEWLPTAKKFYKKKLERIERNRKKMISDSMNNPTTYEQLEEMCLKIGHLPSKTSHEITQKWLQVTYAIKHCVNMGTIDDQQGYDLFNIVSGNESNQKQWQSIKPRGDVSIATIIHFAQKNGYIHNPYTQSLKHTPELIEKETIYNKDYIETETMINLIKRNQKLIVDAATGSGKTTATVNAFKQLAKDDTSYFIFTAPTIVLAEQIAIDHNITCIKGSKKIYSVINSELVQGNNVFVSTYDVTNVLINHIKKRHGTDFKFYVVVDEIHKYTEAYNYRFAAIDSLENISSNATSFIGLTGTPEDVLKDKFDKLIKINTGNDKSPLTDFRVFTYGELDSKTKVIDSANILLLTVIRSVLAQTRLIVFINNTERITTISRLLRKENINFAIVTSSKKQSATYRDIVTTGTIDDKTQVILTTTVLSDGVTIKNDLDWSCLVVSDRESPIFNPSTVKQISNRFRNQYRYFLMFMRTPNEDYSDLKRFNMESDYNYKLGITDNYTNYLNETYQDKYDDFIASTVEKRNGIFYRSEQEDAEITYNPLYLRHNAMKDKEKYYQIYRQAFVKEVSRLVGKDVTGYFNVNEELKANGTDLSSLLSEVQQEAEEKELTNEELRNNFAAYFTEDVYLAIKNNDDKSTINYFTLNVHSDNVSATFKNVRIASYDTCLKLGESVTRRADINSYVNDVRGLTHIAVFSHVKKVTVTKAIFNKLLEHAGKIFLSSELKQLTKDMANNVKINKQYVKPKDVKEALKMFDNNRSRSNGNSLNVLKPLTIESVASKHGLSQEQVKDSIVRFIKTQPKQRQKVMLKAVEKEYGITL